MGVWRHIGWYSESRLLCAEKQRHTSLIEIAQSQEKTMNIMDLKFPCLGIYLHPAMPQPFVGFDCLLQLQALVSIYSPYVVINASATMDELSPAYGNAKVCQMHQVKG